MDQNLFPNSFSGPTIFHRSCFAMNTRFSIVLVGIDRERAEEIASGAEHDLRKFERLMSRFDVNSPVSELNQLAGASMIQPPSELWEILCLCRDYWKRTNGTFDITMWPLNHLWREHLKLGAEPSPQVIARTRELTGMERMLFDDATHSLMFQIDGMSIDLGGFGKGFAIERIAGDLRAKGVEQAFLSFGESSITVLGSHPFGPAWPVGIADIFHPSEVVHTFHLRDASLSSSGTGPSNSIAGPTTFGHIIDPRTGRPLEGCRTMSVSSPSGIEAEVLSTALLLIPPTDRAALLSGFSANSAVEIVYYSNGGDFVPRIEWQYGI